MNLEPLEKLKRDVKKATITLSNREARFLTDLYYQLQDNRIRADGQVRSMGKDGEPHATITWFSDQAAALEAQVKSCLDAYSKAHPVGQWLRGQKGIGPVLAAGLLAHIDIHKAPTAGHIWSFAGLDPNRKWNKGEKRPHNADLKRLCWLIGESFVKVSGNENAFYGQLYKQQKAVYIARNESGGFADRAKDIIAEGRYKRDTGAKKAYEGGKLPDAHIHAMAKRYAVKIFLSHLHEVWRKSEGLDIPAPFPIAHLGHVHKIEVPNSTIMNDSDEVGE